MTLLEYENCCFVNLDEILNIYEVDGDYVLVYPPMNEIKILSGTPEHSKIETYIEENKI
jgi:hypothetical protein